MGRGARSLLGIFIFGAACVGADPDGGEANEGPRVASAAASQEKDPDVVAASALVGTWRAVLASPGGDLPFGLVVERRDGALSGVAVNGEERVALSAVTDDEGAVVLRLDGYDSRIDATLSSDEQRLEGRWSKTIPDGRSELGFSATKGEGQARFSAPVEAPAYPVPASVKGAWALTFAEEDGGRFVGRAELAEAGADGEVRGTILTDTGDYRFLAGRYARGTLELSCFDGGHAFLFRAVVDHSGVLEGSFWSRDSYHATFTGRRLQEGDEDGLADPFSVVEVVDPERRFRFAFPDLDGKELRFDDPRFEGKIVLAEVFGTWCPNCNDYAPVLAGWDREYRGEGLEVVGLAFEMTGNVERDREFVGKYATRHGIDFPLLLAGTSDKKAAAELLPSIDRVASFPTTVLVGRDGKIAKIHSGFAGPATGRHHTELVAALEKEIEALLAAER